MSVLQHNNDSGHIPLEGTPNFRDFGGCPSVHGGRVRRSVLFRSGELSGLTQTDLARLQSLDIRLVFDFRRDDERSGAPSQFPPGAVPKIIGLPINPGSSARFNLLEGGGEESIGVDDVIEFMHLINREFVYDHSAHFRSMFEHLLNHSEGASLIHCSAGKDRTGFAAAMILSALGVPRAFVIRDYLRSAEYFDIDRELVGICQRMRWRGDRNVVRPILEVREEYLCAAFDTIAKKFSELDDYLTDELAVDSSAREALRQRYLEL